MQVPVPIFDWSPGKTPFYDEMKKEVRAYFKDNNLSYKARPSLIPSLCTHFTRAGIEWRR